MLRFRRSPVGRTPQRYGWDRLSPPSPPEQTQRAEAGTNNLERPVKNAGSSWRFRVFDFDPAFRRTRAIRRIQLF
jgi:hypothetical protein